MMMFRASGVLKFVISTCITVVWVVSSLLHPQQSRNMAFELNMLINMYRASDKQKGVNRIEFI